MITKPVVLRSDELEQVVCKVMARQKDMCGRKPFGFLLVRLVSWHYFKGWGAEAMNDVKLVLARATEEDLHLFDLWRVNERLIDGQLTMLIKEKAELYQQYDEIWKMICMRHNLPENADLTICRETRAITFVSENEGR